MMKLTLLQRFWRKVDLKNPDGCWEWLAGKTEGGYGAFGVNGKLQYTHRFVWEYYNGTIPKGLYICHSCDARSFVNLKHLFLGTPADNVKDRNNKDRQAKGEFQGNSKLTKTEVLAIRADIRSQRKIALDFGISKSQVSYIKNRKQWKHLT